MAAVSLRVSPLELGVARRVAALDPRVSACSGDILGMADGAETSARGSLYTVWLQAHRQRQRRLPGVRQANLERKGKAVRAAKRHRLRRFLKWTGFAATALCILAIVVA